MGIKQIREITGLSQAAFAKKYGLPLRTLENWEMGKLPRSTYQLKWLERIVKDDYPDNK